MTSYADFWNWFAQYEKDFHRRVRQQDNIAGYFLGKALPRLQEVQEGIHLLTGMATEETADLVLSANGDLKNMVFVDEAIAAAPSLEGWQFKALRPQMDMGERGIVMGEYEFSKNKISFYEVPDADYPDEVNIVLVHSELTDENRDLMTNGTYIFLDHLLGEWNFATLIDSVEVRSTEEATEELVPIEKISDFLLWRQKEFVEKYEGTRKDTQNDQHALYEGEQEDGSPLIALMNTNLLAWDAKASHPWILVVEINYDGSPNNGLPDELSNELLNEIEDKLLAKLRDKEGYLNLGRQSANGTREIYFACQEFKKSSKEVSLICEEYDEITSMEYDIYKDKYWRSLARFTEY